MSRRTPQILGRGLQTRPPLRVLDRDFVEVVQSFLDLANPMQILRGKDDGIQGTRPDSKGQFHDSTQVM